MTFSKQTLIFLALIVLAFLVGLCSNGKKDLDRMMDQAVKEVAFKNRIADLNREKESLAKVGLAYRDTLEQVRVKYSGLLIRKESKISEVKRRVEVLKKDTTVLPAICAGKDSLISAQDTLISELEGTIVILKEEKGATWNAFNKVISNDKEQIASLQSEVDELNTYTVWAEDEIKYQKKKARKARRQRNLAYLVGLVFLGLAVTN